VELWQRGKHSDSGKIKESKAPFSKASTTQKEKKGKKEIQHTGHTLNRCENFSTSVTNAVVHKSRTAFQLMA
jgi:hypothetical protein